MEQPKKSKLRNQGEIRQHKEVDWIDKAFGSLTHLFTAFGYAAGKAPKVDAGLEILTAKDLASTREAFIKKKK